MSVVPGSSVVKTLCARGARLFSGQNALCHRGPVVQWLERVVAVGPGSSVVKTLCARGTRLFSG